MGKLVRTNGKPGYHEIIPRQGESPILFNYAKVHYAEDCNDRASILSWHEQLEVKYFLTGGAEITCGSSVFLAQTGNLLVINPYEYHKSRIYEPEVVPVYHLMSIELDHPSVRSVLRENPELLGERSYADDSSLPFLKNLIQDPSLPCVTLFLLLAEEYKRTGDGYSPFKENLLRSFLYSLIRDGANREHGEYSSGRKASTGALLPALQYIDEHIQENIRISTLADRCMLSVSRFSHLFKEVTGTSAVSYIQDLRVSKAAVLLCTTELSVNEVAEQVGFCDAAYFSRAFKKNCGVSPKEYRRKQT